jgi:uncharacterized membrane protein
MNLFFRNIYKNKFNFLIFTFFLCIFLRFYNINFEDLWFDEQASFLVANPKLSFEETISLSKNLDNGTSIVFNLILKNYFNLFVYNPDISRFLTVIFGIISILALAFLNFKISKNNGYKLVAFLSSINWYLISYSQELRPYSFLFLLSILSIIFFFSLLENNENKILNYKYILYSLISVLAAATHIFFFIIFISQIVFLILNKSKIKNNFYTRLFYLLIVPVIYLLIMYDYLLLQININDFWIKQVELDFFIDFYFSRFFGSKIMGLIYLSILIYLIIANKKLIFKFSSRYFFLLLLLILSYSLPLIYSLFKQPILIDRYIIFVLVPILILTSSLLFELKKKKIRYFLIFTILTSTIANNYLEIFQREISKPEFKKTIKYILNSKNDKNLVVFADHEIHKKIILNYTKNLISNKIESIKFITDIEKEKPNNFWLFCYQSLNSSNCNYKKISSLNYKINDTINYKLMSAILYEK